MNRTIPRITFETRNASSDSLGFVASILSDGDRVFASGGAGRCLMLASADGGKTFVERPVPKGNGLRKLAKLGDLLAVPGEYGMLAVSNDAGFSWTPIPLDTDSCLFRVIEEPSGERWVVGDHAFIARAPKGTCAFETFALESEARFHEAEILDGRLALVGDDGNLWWRTGDTFEPKPTGAKSANMALQTSTGTILVACNKGELVRSVDRGGTFTRVETHCQANLEAIISTAHGIFVGGSDGVLLFSSDDGQTFTPVPTGTTQTLWAFDVTPSGLLVGGDKGAILDVVVSATETMSVDITDADVAVQAKDDDDDDDDDDSDEEAADDAKTRELPSFASLEDASERWKREGKEFITALNGYVDRVYAVGVNKAGKEPSETREDMADYVREQLAALNSKGEHKRARELFPPAYEPFDYDGLGEPVRQLCRLPDGRTLSQVDNNVYLLERDKITEHPEAVFFAVSPDRRLVGLGYADRIDVHEGWDGKKVRSLPMPAVRGGAVQGAQLTQEGDAALVSTDGSVVWLTEGGSRVLMPEGGGDDSPSYIHGTMSPNGRFVAIGCQDSSHILIDRKTGERHTFDTVSSYPHFAFFHDARPEVLFNSVHGLYGSGSLAVSIDAVATGKGESARIFDRRSWLFSAAALPDGYLLGDRGGYIWCIDFERNQKWYAFVGSSLTAMDVSLDKKTLLVGSYAGYVIEIDLTAEGRDPMLLTNGNLRETARWVFWNGHDPMIW